MAVLAFPDAGCRDVARAGGKGASLARLAALEMPVPPGFVVTADVLAAALPDGGAALRELVSERGASAAEQAQRMVRETTIPDELRAALAQAHAALGEDVPVAVRSSACAEDGEAASFAGQQETYLHVRGLDATLDRLRECWASFFSERALFYRGEKGSLDDIAMAVVVQRMVEPEVAGVMFTVDPVGGRKDRIVIEAVLGLGEAVVSGEVTPDHYVLKRDGTVRRRQVHVQPFRVVGVPGGGTAKEPLDEQLGGRPKLNDEQLRALAEVGAELERITGVPQDIEWALADGELFVLQARPVTT
jgi:pyruvate, water dikinase